MDHVDTFLLYQRQDIMESEKQSGILDCEGNIVGWTLVEGKRHIYTLSNRGRGF